MNIEVGKEYQYFGDTTYYHSKICTIKRLHEYEKVKDPGSYVIIQFENEISEWAVRVNSLKEVTT